MTAHTISDWVEAFLASDPPRSKSLVMTIFGDAIAPHGGAVWLGSLIELLAPLAVNDRLLRTSVFRLAQEGWLGANRDGRRSAYAILPQALPRFERANRRIYAQPGVQWDGNWTLVLGAASAIDAPARAALRKELLWEGYGQLAPGSFGHPAPDAAILDEIVKRVGVQGKLLICKASELAGVASRPLRELVGESWDLSGVAAGYAQFIAQFAPLLEAVLRDPAVTAQQAYVVRTLLIHAYRRVQLHDPQLPVELLPAPWPGSQAYALARQLYRATFAQADRHIIETMRREDPAAPDADAAFYQRFGGLQ
ncbi:MAG: phenylacetic acid degradation operon negative regulatory protein PaaX [Pseudomonadota bacterium]